MADLFYPEFLVERPSDQRVWVVRASGGAYTSHFRTHKVMAIGHADQLGLLEGAIGQKDLDSLQSRMQREQPDRAKASITSHANQIVNFCSTIKQDDLVVTIGSNGLTFGRVAGAAYVARNPLEIKSYGGDVYKMNHQLRRPVEWGPRLARSQVPTALQMSLLAHQTVFNIDEYWQSIYHLLYPCFTYDGCLYLSANIKQTESLDNYSISQMFALLSGVEALAREFDQPGDVVGSYPTLSMDQLERLDLNLTSKAEFMSPGAIWAQVAMDYSGLIWGTVIYVMLFGGNVTFFKTDGLIDSKTRQKVWARVLKLMETHGFDRIKQKLKIDVPRVDTTALKPKRLSKSRATNKNVAKLQAPKDDIQD